MDQSCQGSLKLHHKDWLGEAEHWLYVVTVGQHDPAWLSTTPQVEVGQLHVGHLEARLCFLIEKKQTFHLYGVNRSGAWASDNANIQTDCRAG